MKHGLLCSVTLSLLLSAAPAVSAPAPTDLKTHSSTSDIDETLFITEADGLVASQIEKRITQGKYDDKITEEFSGGVLEIFRRAYAGRVFKPIWTEQGVEGLNAYVDDMFSQGIIADDVFKNDLADLQKSRFEKSSPKSRAKADIKLTLAFFRAASAVSGGLKDEGGVDEPKLNAPLRFNLTDALLKSGQGNIAAELEGLEPEHKQYRALKSQLRQYRAIRDQGGWLAIPEGEIVEPGEKDARLPALRNRLKVEGFLNDEATRSYLDVTAPTPSTEPETDETLFDEDTAEALKAFQTRHGLEPDGVIGPNTLLALNESPESKIDRIADTMYRWRHQGDMGERHIWANIPSFTAEGWNDGMREIKMKTIVGKARHATPEFNDEVEYVVANPKWFVPVSITRRQKIPKMRKDANYANKYNYTVSDRETGEIIDPLTVDWSEPGVGRKYRFVQGPGEGNALGEMKIIFPNQYSVYLHGTPGKALFDRAQRAFSSGCIRLEDPSAMAKWIAEGDADINKADIAEALAEEERERFVLDEKLPVHITYFTVTVNDDGTANFWRDIYDRDDGITYVEKYAKPIVKVAAN